MQTSADPRLVKKLSAFASIASVFSVATGLSGLAGWAFHLRNLTSWEVAPVKMVANTAACMTLVGISLWLRRRGDGLALTRARMLAANASASIAAVVGLLSLAEHAFGWDLGIDQLLFVVHATEMSAGVRPGLMSSLTAFDFLALGVALLLLDWKTQRNHWPAQFLVLGAAISTAFGVLALALHPGQFPFSMSWPTAVTFSVLGCGLLGSRAPWALGGMLTGRSAGARLLRKAAPTALLVLSTIGFSISKPLLADSHFSWIRVSLLAVFSSSALAGLIAWMAVIVERSDALNADLERRVAQRTAALGESEGRLAGVIESAMDAILTVDEQQNIVLFNAAAERMFRYPAIEAIGQPLTRFIPQRFHSAHAAHIRRFAATGVTNRTMGPKDVLWALRADGQEFQIEASISQVVSGGKELFTVILRDVTGRVQAEALREHLAAVVASSDDAIISKDLNGIINAWNRGAEKIFGYSASEATGRPMVMLFPPELVSEEVEILARIRRGQSVEHYETVRVRKDGSRIDVSVTISPIRDSRGAIVGASKIARDITERKQAEEALLEQARVLDLAQVMVRDLEGGIVSWSIGTEKLYGYSREEAIGRVSHELLQTQFPEPLEQIERKLVRTGIWEGELTHCKKNGRRVTVASTWVLHRDAAGNPKRILESNADITERKNAERQLAAQAQELSRQGEELLRSRESLEAQKLMLQTVLDSISEGLVAADETGKFLLWNPAATKIVGMGAQNVPPGQWNAHYGVYLPDAVTPFPPEQNPLLRAIRGEACVAEMYVHNPELESGVWIEASASPLGKKSGAVRGGVIAFRDITQRRLDEQKILQLNEELEERVVQRTAQLMEANREMEAFTYSVSHDLRAPLRHIAGFSRILAEDFGSELAPEARDHVRRIEDGVHRMGLLVDELLSLARVGRHAIKLQQTDLSVVVEEVVSMLQPEVAGRAVNWKITSLPAARCDAILVKQVFQNFIANALKFTRPRQRADIEISCRRENGSLVISVRDNDVGFNMKYADKLFGVFQRLHRDEDFEGTGIGLATVQRIVHKHGGRVWAEGELDKGATFHFTLPAWDAAPAAMPVEAAPAIPVREMERSTAAGAQL